MMREDAATTGRAEKLEELHVNIKIEQTEEKDSASIQVGGICHTLDRELQELRLRWSLFLLSFSPPCCVLNTDTLGREANITKEMGHGD